MKSPTPNRWAAREFPPTLFSFLKLFWATLGPLRFHLNFRIGSSLSVHAAKSLPWYLSLCDPVGTVASQAPLSTRPPPPKKKKKPAGILFKVIIQSQEVAKNSTEGSCIPNTLLSPPASLP